MTYYTVQWEILLDAEDPIAAAREALIVMQDTDQDNICHIFNVSQYQSDKIDTIDLDEIGWTKESKDSELIL